MACRSEIDANETLVIIIIETHPLMILPSNPFDRMRHIFQTNCPLFSRRKRHDLDQGHRPHALIEAQDKAPQPWCTHTMIAPSYRPLQGLLDTSHIGRLGRGWSGEMVGRESKKPFVSKHPRGSTRGQRSKRGSTPQLLARWQRRASHDHDHDVVDEHASSARL